MTRHAMKIWVSLSEALFNNGGRGASGLSYTPCRTVPSELKMVLIETQVNLRKHNTFAIDVTAQYLTRIRCIADLQAFIHDHSSSYHQAPVVLGGGSNILFTTEFFPGVILKNEISGIKILTTDSQYTTVEIGGGVVWTDVVAYCLEHDLGGVENLSLIPGTMGAAPVQNIGAYGATIGDVLDSVAGVDLMTGEQRTFSTSDCQLGYRDSAFKHKLRNIFITTVTLRLTNHGYHRLTLTFGTIQETLQGQHPTIHSIAEAVTAIRRTKLPDPAVLGNAGSFFKSQIALDQVKCLLNTQGQPIAPPVFEKGGSYQIPAGWLIEQCGWKGKRLGDASVYSKHALVLVNHGQASGIEILHLSNQIVDDVHRRFGVVLVPEVVKI